VHTGCVHKHPCTQTAYTHIRAHRLQAAYTLKYAHGLRTHTSVHTECVHTHPCTRTACTQIRAHRLRSHIKHINTCSIRALHRPHTYVLTDFVHIHTSVGNVAIPVPFVRCTGHTHTHTHTHIHTSVGNISIPVPFVRCTGHTHTHTHTCTHTHPHIRRNHSHTCSIRALHRPHTHTHTHIRAHRLCTLTHP
jgi:hypothetical protein